MMKPTTIVQCVIIFVKLPIYCMNCKTSNIKVCSLSGVPYRGSGPWKCFQQHCFMCANKTIRDIIAVSSDEITLGQIQSGSLIL